MGFLSQYALEGEQKKSIPGGTQPVYSSPFILLQLGELAASGCRSPGSVKIHLTSTHPEGL